MMWLVECGEWTEDGPEAGYFRLAFGAGFHGLRTAMSDEGYSFSGSLSGAGDSIEQLLFENGDHYMIAAAQKGARDA